MKKVFGFVGESSDCIFIIPNVMYIKDYKSITFSFWIWFFEITTDTVYAKDRERWVKKVF